jgi:hypothetical protein
MNERFNRLNGVAGEEIELYTFFYREHNGEIVLREPSSLGYVQILKPTGAVCTNADISGITVISPGISGFPSNSLSSVIPGVKKVRFVVPDLNYTDQVKFIDKWVDFKDERGGALAIQNNIFFVSPRNYGIDSLEPTNKIDLAISADENTIRVGEKKFFKFSVTDNNNILKNIDNPVLSFYTANDEKILSNVSSRIPEGLNIHYFLDTIWLQSYVNANYIESSLATQYPLLEKFESSSLEGYDVNSGSRILYVGELNGTTVQFRLPSHISLNENRKVVPQFLSDKLSNISIIDKDIRFSLKENDGDYVEYNLPGNIVNKTADEIADQFSFSLKDQKEKLKNKDDLFYTFSNIDGRLSIKGKAGETSSLSIKNVTPYKFTEDLPDDFSLYEGELKIYNDKINKGPTAISAGLQDYSSVTYRYTDYNNLTIVSESTAGAITTKNQNSVITVRTSSVTNEVFLSISEDDGEFLPYSLPFVGKGLSGSVKAATISSYLKGQATVNKTASLISYSFSVHSPSSLKISCPSSVRKIRFKYVNNAANNYLKGNFAVDPTVGSITEIVGDITVPVASSIFNTVDLSGTKRIIRIAENEGSYIDYNLPSNTSNINPYDLANYLQDLREDYGTSIYYDFSTKITPSKRLVVSGTPAYTKKLKLKYDKYNRYAGSYLGGEFELGEDELKTFFNYPVRSTASDIAYTIASNLTIQGYNNDKVRFSSVGDNFILRGTGNGSSLFVTDASYIAPYLLSTSLSTYSSLATGKYMKIKENSGSFITYEFSALVGITEAQKASRIVKTLEEQRENKTYYYFEAVGSKLALVGIPILTSSITLDNSTIESTIYNKLGGDFAVPDDTKKVDSGIMNLYSSSVNRILGGDFSGRNSGTALVALKSSISNNNVITKVKPINIDEDYKFVAQLQINEKIIKLDSKFNFSQ